VGIKYTFNHTQKKQKMKKVFAILAVAGFMASCNSGENKDAAADSARIADSTAAATAAADSAAKAAADTTHKMDTTATKK
jgi:hypothetical protein